MSWPASLSLDYRRDGPRTVLRHRHSGPLRVLRSLYPEAPAVCHDVLVHPPGGLVGGDTLDIAIALGADAHALVTTPGATRFYRSSGAAAGQSATAELAPGARLEWLPLETLCHAGALAENRMRFALAPGAEMIGWDLLALGLPARGEAFDSGRVTQHIELAGAWLERGLIDGRDRRLLESPLGWANRIVMATLWFGAGAALASARAEALLEAARDAVTGDGLAESAGATAPNPHTLVLRVLAHQVEPARALLEAVWARWRQAAWGLAPCRPRVWRL